MKLQYILDQYSKLSKYFLNFVDYEKYKKEVKIIKKFLKPQCRVLDIGCGAGIHSGILARYGFSVTGIDVCPEMIKLARKINGRKTNLRFKVMDMRKISLKEKFDAAIFLHSFYYLTNEKDVKATLSSLRKCLKKGGQVIVLHFSPFHSLLHQSFKWNYLIEDEKNGIRRKILIRHKLNGNILFAFEKHSYTHGNKTTEFTARGIYRVFTPLEVSSILKENGFKIITLSTPFKDHMMVVSKFVL